MLSFVARLTGPPLPIDFFEVQTSSVAFGYLEPLTDPPVLVGMEAFDGFAKVVVLHVPDRAVADLLGKSIAVEWIEGSLKAEQDATLGKFNWPEREYEDSKGQIVKYRVGVPIIAGGSAPKELR